MSRAIPWRLAFLAYALVIATLTHWPGVAIDSPIPRPDLLVHAAVFSLWTVLCIRSGLAGRWGRWPTVGLGSGASAAYAGLDEWTQQFFTRHSSWDDFGANLVGVGLGTIVAAAWTWLRRRRPDNRPPP